MSTTWAIAAVTGVLKSMLGDAYHNAGLGGQVNITAKAPDVVQAGLTSPNEASQTNLFLHQVTPNAAWRNVGLPSLAADGSTRLKNPPLALDLHYLLTVYASIDAMAEALLGPAVLMLFEFPVVSRNQISNYLSTLSNTDPIKISGLADQIELIKITPATLGREEIAWIWTALKADYRPTFPFQVSVVLIQPQTPTFPSLPVLTRTINVQPNLQSALPTITAIMPPHSQPAAIPGDVVTVAGSNLAGTQQVTLVNTRLQLVKTINITGPGNASFQFALPDTKTSSDPAAGVYLLTAQTADGNSSNGLPLALAPQIRSPLGLTMHPTDPVTVTFAPFVQPGQQIYLLVGGQEGVADAPAAGPAGGTNATAPTAANSLTFRFTGLQPTTAKVPVRLRIDGIDSPIIDMTKSPPAYSGPAVQVIA